jgi:predicted site-specific integrase-resolvase
MNMKTNQRYATALIRAVRTIPKPSQFVSSIDRLRPCRVVLYLRVSARTQRDNLLHQLTRLRAELEKRGFTVIAVYQEIVPGWDYMCSGRWGRLRLLGREEALAKFDPEHELAPQDCNFISSN